MEKNDLAKILIVDDISANLKVLKALLSKVDVQVFQAQSGNEALTLVLEHDFAMFLLDVQMPEMDGYELAKILSEDDATQDVPIIFVTAALRDEVHRLQGYALGAIDYIEKPLNDSILLSKVNILLKIWQKNKQLNVLLSELAEKNLALQSEIASRKKIESKLDHMAMYDALTNLPNRSLLKKESQKCLAAAKRYELSVGFMFLDLDGFKTINDNHGHEAGDVVLVEMAYRLVEAVRESDLVTRFGGDEFVILLPDCKCQSDIEEIACRILDIISKPLTSIEIEERLGASIGIAVYPEDGLESDVLISKADKAMYQVKKSGKHQYHFTDSDGDQ